MNLDTVSSSGASWISQLEAELIQCDYLVLLLSARMAISEMVIEILQRIGGVPEENYGDHKPLLLAIHLCSDIPFSLNHDLRNYLSQAQQYLWTTSEDEEQLLQDLLKMIQTGNPPPSFSRGIRSVEDSDSDSSETRESNLPFPDCQSSKVSSSTPPVESLPQLPFPVADPELPQGQVRLASAFYLERDPQDSLCYEEIFKPGALIRIKAPRQMGKTSLMARILYTASEKGCRSIPLSFQHADREIFSNLSQLLRWLCVRVARKLRLPPRLDEFWTDAYGSKDNCTAYFEDYLLPEISTPLVLGMDEVDRVFQYSAIVDDFFGLLRAWYEEGRLWNRWK